MHRHILQALEMLSGPTPSGPWASVRSGACKHAKGASPSSRLRLDQDKIPNVFDSSHCVYILSDAGPLPKL